MATAALFVWPILGLLIFSALGPARGLVWSVVIGYLLLPARFEIDLPVLPPYDKATAVAFSSVLGISVFRRQIPKADMHLAAMGFRRMMFGCLFLLIVAPVFTVLTNSETLVNGNVVRPALGPWDAVALSSNLLIDLIPFLLAWLYLGKTEHIRELLVAMVVLGLGYTLLVLFEIRMSPQLHRWVYGYFPHSWVQHLRDGDFRPLVFLEHGLSLGFFLLSVAVAAFTLARQDGRRGGLYLAAGLWTLGVLMISNNLGATMLALIFCPAIFFMSRRLQIILAAAVAGVLLTYPLLTQYSAAPVERVLVLAERISVDRARSFQTRLDNESELLARGLEKPIFGWGGWDRGRIYDENGRDRSITDGTWIIIFGQRGWTGYLAFFGLLTLPILFLGRTARRKEVPPLITGMALMSAANLIYLIPNSTLSPIGLLVFGALASFVQYDEVRETREGPVSEAPSAGAKGPRYSRFREQVADASKDRAAAVISGPTSTSRYRRDTPPKDA